MPNRGRGGEAGPYLVVAHSMGGLYALALLHEHPETVVGLALIDVIPPSYLAPLPNALASSIGLFDLCRSGLARIGLWRLLGSLGALPLDQVDLVAPADRREARAHAFRTDFCATAHAETIALEASASELLDAVPTVPSQRYRANGTEPTVPTVVIVAGARSEDDWPRDDGRWRDAQSALTESTPDGRVVVIDGDHYLPLEHPERVASEIAALIDRLRR